MINILSKIISLLISISFVGCATVSTGNKAVKEPEEYDIYLCENIRLEDIQEGKFKGQKKFISPDNKKLINLLKEMEKRPSLSHTGLISNQIPIISLHINGTTLTVD